MSRNNDIDGYWAMGALYAHAGPGRSQVLIDLMTGQVRPSGSNLSGMIERLRQRLHGQLRARRIPLTRLSGATISVDFNPDQISPRLFESATEGDAFEVVLQLTDDHGYHYREATSGQCWPHDRAKESQSTRAERHAAEIER